jgi:serine/threonine-protein kinase RsbW
MTSEGQPLTLTLPSELRFLSVARAFVEATCQAAGLAQVTIDAIVLATNEAASNVIRHAHRDRPAALMQIRCQLTTDSIEIWVLDEGEPFDLDAVPALDPAELRIGGRGIFLMRTVMDEVSCQRREERGNALRMVKRCTCDLPETPRSAS